MMLEKPLRCTLTVCICLLSLFQFSMGSETDAPTSSDQASSQRKVLHNTLAVGDSQPTILILTSSQEAIDWLVNELSGLDVTLVTNPSSYEFGDYDMVIAGGLGPSMQPLCRAYVQAGGNLVLTHGGPYYLAGSTNLTSISDIVGVSNYGNTSVGYVITSENYPYRLPYEAGDTIGYANAGAPQIANVSGALDSLLYKVYWSDGTLHSYLYQAYAGKYFFFCGWDYGDEADDIFLAAVHWMLFFDESVYYGGTSGRYQRILIPPNFHWNQCRDSAAALGGNLATASSPGENSFLAWLADPYATFLGGTDETQEGDWQWLTGESWSFTAWRQGEPNNAWADEDYVALFPSDSLWNDSRSWFVDWQVFIVEHSPTSVEIGDGTQTLPEHIRLAQNYPNPFNSGTSIEYSLRQGGHVTVSVLNLLGQTVALLVNEDQAPGEYRTIWDGRDSEGHQVSTGIYFYRLQVGEISHTLKMILLK